MDKLHTKDPKSGRIVSKTCIYDENVPATQTCIDCGTGLCSFCGFTDDKGRTRCNSCYRDYQREVLGICPDCGQPLEPIYENNGFTEPEGPSHWEITGFKPCYCGEGK